MAVACDGEALNLNARLAPPSSEHWLGTDHLGRDLLARIAEGTGRTVAVVLIVASLSLGVGVPLGLIAALNAGSPLAALVLRLADLAVSVPQLIVALALTAVLGLTPVTAGLALSLSGWAHYALVVHGLARAVMREPYWRAAEAMGSAPLAAARRHLWPSVARPTLALAGAEAGRTVALYASLAFVGLGADTSAPDWGALVWEYRLFLFEAPHLVLSPVAATALLALGLHLGLDHHRTPGVLPHDPVESALSS